jgi:prophage tail gpP-like protein
MSTRINIKINGQSFDKWESVAIYKSIDTISGTFAAATTDFFPGEPTKWNIKPGDSCIVEVDDQKIITGYIDDFNIEYDVDGNAIKIIGRDKTSDLVDCAFDSEVNEWKNQTILNLIKNMCNPFNIAVNVDTNITDRTDTIIDTFKIDEGEVISNEIIKLCIDNAILPICYNDGKLTLTNTSASRKMNDQIEVGNNAKKGIFLQSNKERYSKYIVKGQGIGNDEKKLNTFISPYGIYFDNVVSRNRTKIIFADNITDSGKCINRAKWEGKLRAGKSRARQYVVEDWTQKNGKIWEINSLVNVVDEFFNINGSLLITDIVYNYDEEDGEIALLTLIDPSAYDLNDKKIIKTGFDR